MSQWSSAKARKVLAALLRIGWTVKRQSGSHRILSRAGWPDTVFAFHDREEIGPRMLVRIAKRTGSNTGRSVDSGGERLHMAGFASTLQRQRSHLCDPCHPRNLWLFSFEIISVHSCEFVVVPH